MMARDLNQRMNGAFARYIGEPIGIEVKGSKNKRRQVDGWIIGVYPSGILFEGPTVREFFAFVDFYTRDVLVKSGSVKQILEVLMPELNNLALLLQRSKNRNDEQTVLVGR